MVEQDLQKISVFSVKKLRQRPPSLLSRLLGFMAIPNPFAPAKKSTTGDEEADETDDVLHTTLHAKSGTMKRTKLTKASGTSKGNERKAASFPQLLRSVFGPRRNREQSSDVNNELTDIEMLREVEVEVEVEVQSLRENVTVLKQV